MNILKTKRIIAALSTATLLAVIAACAPKPEQPVARYTPPPVVQTPMRPYPPMGASPTLVTPQALADGTRLTVNYGLSSDQTAWNLRSAYNVAALSCHNPKYASLQVNYEGFLKRFRTQLRSINRSLDRSFKDKHGSNYIRKREAVQTRVYNYFALPPVVPALCDTAMIVGQELKETAPKDYKTYAPTGLAKLENAYCEFFDSFDQYRTDLAAWEAR